MLSSQPEEVVFTCSPCSHHRDEQSSLKVELQSRLIAGLEEVLTDLLSDDTMKHLLICEAVRDIRSLVTDNILRVLFQWSIFDFC